MNNCWVTMIFFPAKLLFGLKKSHISKQLFAVCQFDHTLNNENKYHLCKTSSFGAWNTPGIVLNEKYQLSSLRALEWYFTPFEQYLNLFHPRIPATDGRNTLSLFWGLFGSCPSFPTPSGVYTWTVNSDRNPIIDWTWIFVSLNPFGTGLVVRYSSTVRYTGTGQDKAFQSMTHAPMWDKRCHLCQLIRDLSHVCVTGKDNASITEGSNDFHFMQWFFFSTEMFWISFF